MRKAVPRVAVEAACETLEKSHQRPAGPGVAFMEALTASEVLKVQTARINFQRLKSGLASGSPPPGYTTSKDAT